MSTGYINSNIQAKRFLLLSALGDTIYHSGDLANIWLIKDKNTLYTTLKRYQKAGLIHRLYKGLYSLVPFTQLDSLYIGTKALHQYCYVSTETILFREGYLSQSPSFTTFISTKSLTFKVKDYSYKSRKLQEKLLLNPLGIKKEKNFNIASPERAIADMLYFNPYCHFDKKVDWKKIRPLQKALGYPLTPSRYDSASSR